MTIKTRRQRLAWGGGRKKPNAKPKSNKDLHIIPQEGPQDKFFRTSADIAVYGGAAGGGKTWALLAECARHAHNPHFGAVIFRRSFPQIKNEGGLWDEAQKIYAHKDIHFKESDLTMWFPTGAKVKFAHLQHEKTKKIYQGAQICYLGFDELTHFTKGQFFYLLSRNRSTCGVKPYVRATTNPEASSWVKTFLAPWVDRKWRENEAKLAEEEGRRCLNRESGEILYMRREGDTVEWIHPDDYDPEKHDYILDLGNGDIETVRCKTVTFIASSVYDNKVLMRQNPEYVANLHSLTTVERLRLLEGDWDVEEGEMTFERSWFPLVDDTEIPWDRLKYFTRYWDFASTDRKDADKDTCYTCGLLLAKDKKTGVHYVLDIKRVQYKPDKVHDLVMATAWQDYEIEAYGGSTKTSVAIFGEQEPGSSGADVINAFARELAGFKFAGDRPTGDKETRAAPVASSASHGLIRVRKAPWSAAFLDEIEVYPLGKKDQVDALAGAFNQINSKKKFSFA